MDIQNTQDNFNRICSEFLVKNRLNKFPEIGVVFNCYGGAFLTADHAKQIIESNLLLINEVSSLSGLDRRSELKLDIDVLNVVLKKMSISDYDKKIEILNDLLKYHFNEDTKVQISNMINHQLSEMEINDFIEKTNIKFFIHSNDDYIKSKENDCLIQLAIGDKLYSEILTQSDKSRGIIYHRYDNLENPNDYVLTDREINILKIFYDKFSSLKKISDQDIEYYGFYYLTIPNKSTFLEAINNEIKDENLTNLSKEESKKNTSEYYNVTNCMREIFKNLSIDSKNFTQISTEEIKQNSHHNK